MVIVKDFYEAVDGARLLKLEYNGSIAALLSKVYPEYEWLPWKFDFSSRNFWSDNKNKKKFIDFAGTQLGIKEMSDWYKVTHNVQF
jgi:hypothetical protein